MGCGGGGGGNSAAPSLSEPPTALKCQDINASNINASLPCTCNSGYTISLDGVSCALNPVAITCQDSNALNLNGALPCSCKSGYTISIDGNTCNLNGSTPFTYTSVFSNYLPLQSDTAPCSGPVTTTRTMTCRRSDSVIVSNSFCSPDSTPNSVDQSKAGFVIVPSTNPSLSDGVEQMSCSEGATVGIKTVICNSNFHKIGSNLSNYNCVADSITCSQMPSGALSGTQVWNGSSYSACTIATCQTGYYLNLNQCKDSNIADFIITNYPVLNSAVNALDVTVTGINISKYKYKVGPTSTTVCSNTADYSVEYDKSTKINESLKNQPYASITLCVLGKSATGVYQQTNFKSATWNRIDECAAIPGSWTRISENSIGVHSAFCVATFEMKNINGVAKSQPSEKPWDNISRGSNVNVAGSALKACSDLGPNFGLIHSGEWQTVARLIELEASNWTGGSVGVGMLYCGHSDASPNSALAVTDVSNPYSDTGNSISQSENQGKEQRRRFSLGAGKYIWDFAGNVNEWISNKFITTTETPRYIQDISDSNIRANFGPTQAYSVQALTKRGLGYLDLSYIADPKASWYRGGDWTSHVDAGVFTLMTTDYDSADASHGFRCVYRIQP